MPSSGHGRRSSSPASQSRAGVLVVDILAVRESDEVRDGTGQAYHRQVFGANPYITVSLGTRSSYQSTDVHGPGSGGGLDGRRLATEVEWRESFRLPVAEDVTPRSLGSLAANLKICAYATPPNTWKPPRQREDDLAAGAPPTSPRSDPLLRDSKLADPIGTALVDLKDILHPQRAKKLEPDYFWTHPCWVPFKVKSRRGAAGASQDLRAHQAWGARGGGGGGGGWDSTTSVSSPPGPRPGRSPTQQGVVDITGYVKLAIKYEPSRRSRTGGGGYVDGTVEAHGHERVGRTSGRRARSPRQERGGGGSQALLNVGPHTGAAGGDLAGDLARLESLAHTDEVVQLKQKLKAW